MSDIYEFIYKSSPLNARRFKSLHQMEAESILKKQTATKKEAKPAKLTRQQLRAARRRRAKKLKS